MPSDPHFEPLPSGLGIGLITYNRFSTFTGCVAAVERYTQSPYHLVVGDDGSTDGSASWARERGLAVVSGRNQGIAWNKNRVLYYLLTATACDPILLLEEDCWPCVAGWEGEWVQAARLWEHVNFLDDKWKLTPEKNKHEGTAEDPYRFNRLTGLCTATTRRALYRVGYLDTRFKGYGVEHLDWSYRFWRGYGQVRDAPFYPCLMHGVQMKHIGTYRVHSENAYNANIIHRIKDGPLYTPPFRSDAEAARVQHEQQRARWPLAPEQGIHGLVSVICPTADPVAARRMWESLKLAAGGALYEVVWVWQGNGSCPLPRGNRNRVLDKNLLGNVSGGSLGFAAAVNAGVMASGGEVLVVIEDSVVLTCAGLFEHLLGLYQANPAAGICWGAGEEGAGEEEAREEGEWELVPGASVGRTLSVDRSLSECWAISRRAFCAAGGLDEAAAENQNAD